MADVLVRVAFRGDLVGAFARRRGTAGEACHRVIEAAPPEMYGTDFADEARTKLLEDLVDGNQRALEKIDVVSIVRFVNLILFEVNRFTDG